MRYILAVCLLFFTTTAFAAADFVATYQYPDGNQITIVTRDAQHVRMETSPTSYMLLKENKVYSVSQDDGGQWVVMDMDQVKGLATGGGFMSLFGGGGQEPAKEPETSAVYEKTGRKEKIAGYTGLVYNVELIENGQVVQRDEMVLSSHADLKKVNEGWTAIASKMGEIMGENVSKTIEEATKKAQEEGYGGMLRYGDEMKLASLKKMSLDLSYYQLPQGSKTVQMGAMPPATQPRMNTPKQPQVTSVPQPSVQQPVTVPQPQQQVESELAKDAKDVGQAARDEAKQSAEDEVREGVRTLFKSLFD
ncbi:MAG: hypothetical protein ABIJ31_09035 [Pseudomonadota bacterium]